MARLKELKDSVLQLVEFGNSTSLSHSHSNAMPRLVVIEDYAFSRADQAHAKGELGGVIRLALWERGIETITVAPTALKKFVTGVGVAQKDEMRLAIYKRFGIEAKSQDELEAAALAIMGWHWIGMGEDNEDGEIPLLVPKAHLDGLKKVEVLG